MKQPDRELSRREMARMLAMSAGMIASGATAFDLFGNAASRRSETPNMIVGPFYPRVKPLDRDADLTRLSGRSARAAGTVVDVEGRVVDRNGAPVRDARIEIWQANTFGRYAHPSDPNTAAAEDPNFQGCRSDLSLMFPAAR